MEWEVLMLYNGQHVSMLSGGVLMLYNGQNISMGSGVLMLYNG